MPIRWNLQPLMRAQGIENANQLAEEAGLTLPVAYRLAEGDDLERIDVRTLDKLAVFFKCPPWRLLKYRRKR